MIDKVKLQEAFSDKEYVASIAKLSAEDAAKSLNEKGVEVTADDLMKLRDFVVAHKEELENGELPEEALAGVAGGMDGDTIGLLIVAGGFLLAAGAAILLGW